MNALKEELPTLVRQALQSLKVSGSWALVGNWLLVKLPLGGSERIVVGKVVLEEEIISDETIHTSLLQGKRYDTLRVDGNIDAWLRDNKAKPTKDSNRFVISGWRVIVEELDPRVVEIANHILGKDH